MKRILIVLAAIAATLSLPAQQKYVNFPLPENPDTLRILAIGNSFSGRLYIGGCTLERHCKEYETNGHEYVYLKSTKNKWETVKKYKEGRFMDGLGDEPWDIITMQQGSPKSGRWDSYDPWLGNLIEIVRKECSNPKAAIVWHQTWAYSRTYTNRSFANYAYDQQYMFDSIQLCEYGVPGFGNRRGAADQSTQSTCDAADHGKHLVRQDAKLFRIPQKRERLPCRRTVNNEKIIGGCFIQVQNA